MGRARMNFKEVSFFMMTADCVMTHFFWCDSLPLNLVADGAARVVRAGGAVHG